MESIKRLLRYIIMFSIISFAGLSVSDNKLDSSDIIVIAMVGTISFGFMDLYYPAVIIENNKKA